MVSVKVCVVLLLCAAVTSVKSECCGDPSGAFSFISWNGVKLEPGTCQDCTVGTPCCGNGKCNVFCCDCDDGCRASEQCRTRRDADSHHDSGVVGNQTSRSGRDVVRSADVDGDKRLSYDEAHVYLSRVASSPSYRSRRELHALDLNRDGFLTHDEIDP